MLGELLWTGVKVTLRLSWFVAVKWRSVAAISGGGGCGSISASDKTVQSLRGDEAASSQLFGPREIKALRCSHSDSTGSLDNRRCTASKHVMSSSFSTAPITLAVFT